MPYSTSTIAHTIDRLNTSIFLPAIQRPYVWDDDQVVQLFDSLMKGYPISSFLLWKVAPENLTLWQMYRFAENFRYGDIHTEPVGGEGRDVSLVLDGQQRLTSLLIGLRGSFTLKVKGKRWDNPSAWQKKRLYLDLLVDPEQLEVDADGEEGIEAPYGFQFLANAPASGPTSLWMKVGQILECHDTNQFSLLKDQLLGQLPATANWVTRQTAARNIDRLYEMVWNDEIISTYTEHVQNYDRVLGIFVRANDGGTKLSPSDLMMSVLSSKWSDISAKEEIYNLVDTINTRLDRKNNINKDFIMKSCLVLSDLDPVYKVRNFNNKNLEIMRRNWPEIRTALVRTFRLINRLGIDRDTLTSTNALMPLVYYVFRHDLDLLAAQTPSNTKNISRIRKWLLSTLLLGVFSGHSDGTISTSRSALADAAKLSNDFPYQALNDAVSRQIKRPSYLTDDSISTLLDELRYSHSRIFLLLSLLYDDHNWGSTPHQIDHIVPSSRVNKRSLLAAGASSTQIDAMLAAVDRPGNLELLTASENAEKNDQSFEDWIRTRDPSFMDRHHIPDNESLWSILMLPTFVAERERILRQRLAALGTTHQEILN